MVECHNCIVKFGIKIHNVSWHFSRNTLTNMCYLVDYSWTEMIKHCIAKWEDYTDLLYNIGDDNGDNFREIINKTNKIINISLSSFLLILVSVFLS